MPIWAIVLVSVIGFIIFILILWSLGKETVFFIFNRILIPILVVAAIIAAVFFIGVALLDTYFGTNIWDSLNWF
ncbi:MAG: hypothetical protein HPAVJP_0030 [Candidatus Hepatoplasma vulgare]|nr:MAG: hypothetical protein HPAVJP_0030 [Candidatus Hepatoplasma sp.]